MDASALAAFALAAGIAAAPAADAELVALPPPLCSTAEVDPEQVHAATEATPGAAFTLAEDGEVFPGLVLRVVAPPEETTPFEILSLEQLDPVPATCAEAFCSADGSAPRLLAFDLRYRGGPGVLDVFVVFPEEVPDDLRPRSVEARFLEASEEGAVRLEAGPAVLAGTAVDVRLRVLAPDARSVLAEELVALPSVPDAPDGEPLPPCTSDRCAPSGCSFGCGFALPLLLGALSLRRRRR